MPPSGFELTILAVKQTAPVPRFRPRGDWGGVSLFSPFKNTAFCPQSAFMCFVCISQQTAIISTYSINELVFITEAECVYCAVRLASLEIVRVELGLFRVV